MISFSLGLVVRAANAAKRNETGATSRELRGERRNRIRDDEKK
jgi:hypothetical protein